MYILYLLAHLVWHVNQLQTFGSHYWQIFNISQIVYDYQLSSLHVQLIQSQ